MNTLWLRHAFLTLTTAAAALVSSPASAGPYSNLYVFGDSVSDDGNVALAINWPTGVPQTVDGNGYIPDYPYYPSGTFSNGPVWAQPLAGLLGLTLAPSLAGGNDFAWAGARTGGPDNPVPTLTTQTNQFLGATAGQAPSDALYVIAAVGNDARDAMEAIRLGADIDTTVHDTAVAYAAHIDAMVAALRSAGAQHFLIVDNVDLGLTPAVSAKGSDVAALASALTGTMNAALEAALADDSGVTLFDTYAFVDRVVQQAAAFGFSNVTDACAAVAGADCSGYLFWDGIHPTAAMHQLIAEAAYSAVVPVPQTLALAMVALLMLCVAGRRRPRA